MQRTDFYKTTLKNLIKHGSVIFTSNVVLVVIGVIKSVAISRVLGPANRGIYGLFLTIPFLVEGFGNFGFQPAILYLVAKKGENRRVAFGGILLFSMISGLVWILLGYVFFQFHSLFKGDSRVILNYQALLLFYMPVIFLLLYLRAFLTALNNIVQTGVVTVLLTLFPLLFFLLLLFFGISSLDAAVYAWFVGTTVCLAVLALFFLPKQLFPPVFQFSFIQRALSYGFKGYFTQCFEIALLRIDYLFITAFLNPAELGYYSIAVKLAEMILLLPGSLIVPFIPAAYGMRESESRYFTPLVVKMVFYLMVVIGAGIILFGKHIVLILYGSDFSPAITPLFFLMPGIISLSMYGFLRHELFGRNLNGTISFITGFSLLINIVLNYTLVPRLGITGAAISSSICYSLVTLSCIILFSRVTKTGIAAMFLINREERSRISSYVKKHIRGFFPAVKTKIDAQQL